MTAIAGSVPGLGIGDYPMHQKIIQYGPSGQLERVGMKWRDDVSGGVWVSDPRSMFMLRDSWILGAAVAPLPWSYLSLPIGNPGYIGQSSYSWNPIAIRHADAAFAAGLKLQERAVLDFWAWQPTDDYAIASVLYEKHIGDDISNVDDPAPNIGTIVHSLPGQRRFQTTGWVDSGKQSCAVSNLAPHLYLRKFVATDRFFLEYLFWDWRWVGDPTP